MIVSCVFFVCEAFFVFLECVFIWIFSPFSFRIGEEIKAESRETGPGGEKHLTS